jgi:hypothetical protein
MNIKNIIKEEVENFINEYVTNDEISLMKYLTLPLDEKYVMIAYNYPFFIEKFLEENDNDEMLRELKEFLNDGGTEYEFVYELRSENNELFKEYGEWLYGNMVGYNSSSLDVLPEEMPAWAYFDDQAEIIKNQWLIHFTSDAYGIAKEGFKYGVNEINKLGLTTYYSEFDKKYGGYNFAYTLDDYKKYSKVGSRYKYGEEVVVFRASGVRVWHNTDEEYQTIFYGNTAKNIIPIIDGETKRWGIYSNRSGNLIVEHDDLTKLIYWIIKNYDQYRKHLE